jgi:flagellar biosynthesis GTPase FlhF
MTEHVFRATDSESAMDKAVRELGDDALILSVKRVGDMIEVRAIKESLASVGTRVPDAPLARKPDSVDARLGDVAFARDAEIRKVDLSEALQIVGKSRAQGERPMSEPSGEGLRAMTVVLQRDIIAAPVPPYEASAGLETVVDDTPDAAQLEAMFRHEHAPSADLARDFRADTLAAPVSEEKVQSAAEHFDSLIVPAVGADNRVMESPAPDKVWDADAEQGVGPVEHDAPELTDVPLPEALAHDPVQVPEAAGQDAPEDMRAADLQAPPLASSVTQAPQPHPTLGYRGIEWLGFPSDILQTCSAMAEEDEDLDALAFSCGLLAERLVSDTAAAEVVDGDILFVFGPSGAGKTTVAAKLAFESIRSRATRPVLMRMSGDGFVEDGKLRRYAKLLNTQFQTLKPNDLVPNSAPGIIDCDFSAPKQIQSALAALRNNHPEAAIVPVLVMPGTWSVLGIKHFCQAFPDIAPITVLTHMDIGGIGIGGLSVLSEHGVRLIAASDNDRISDGFSLVDRQSIEDFLRETFSYTDMHLSLGL